MNLLDLPDEILLQVVKWLSDNYMRPSCQYHQRHKSPLLSLNLTCSRMHALTETHLYKNLRIHSSVVFPSEPKRDSPYYNLLSALEMRPHRYSFIETLQFDLRALYIEQQRCQSFLKSLEQSSKLKWLDVRCDWRTLVDYSLVEAVVAKQIRTLHINSAVVEVLTRPGTLQNLESLSISDEIRANSNEEDEDDESWWEKYVLPLERQSISPCQHLEVAWSGTEECHPCTLIPILLWIAALKSLELQFYASSNESLEDFDITSLQRMLDIHSGTLEKIVLSACTVEYLPDFRQFINLHDLHISHFEVFGTDAKTAARRLAAPTLVRIVVDFDQEDQQCAVHQEFEDEHKAWFKRFGRKYRSHIAEGGLQEIQVINVDEEEGMDDEELKKTQAALEQWQICFTWPGAFEEGVTT